MPGYSIAALARAIGARAEGETELRVDRPCHPRTASQAKHLALALDKKLEGLLPRPGVVAAVLVEGANWRELGLRAALLVPGRQGALRGVADAFWQPPAIPTGVHPRAWVEPGARLGEGVAIGPFVEIGADATIGEGTRIFGSTSVGQGAAIGAHSLIASGVRIGERTQIGARAVIHANTVIGSDGFSFEPVDPERVSVAKSGEPGSANGSGGKIEKTRSLGIVVIGDDVEIGAGCAIDRATFEETRIGNGVKLDNLVHIAHNVKIGENCLICGQVGISGSAVIGDRCIFGGQVGVGDHVVVGDDCVIGGKSMIGRRLRPGTVTMGWASLERDEFHSVFRAIRRLARRGG